MYAKKRMIYGNRITERKYHTFRMQQKGGKRVERRKVTPEEVRLANIRMAQKKMVMKMIENFGDNDVEITLTYKEALRPKDWATMKGHWKTFAEKMRKHYKKLGMEFRYMGTIEVNPFHFHVVINSCGDLFALLRELWQYGGVHITPLYQNRDYKGLVKYWFKQSDPGNEDEVENYPGKQRYFCSRNLRKPEVHTETVNASTWREEVKVPKSLEEKGYVLDEDSVERGFDKFGYPYLEYTFICYGSKKRKSA